MKILLFGGTSEGRVLARELQDAEHSVTVSVATAYGGSLLPSGVNAHIGRLDEAQMFDLMAGFDLVLDATHPYAALVTQSIRSATERRGIPLYRVIREEGADVGFLHAADMWEAAKLASELPGNILLTTGSKELLPFVPLKDRCCPRVLPAETSLRQCLELGFSSARIVCMQGPFSRELNEAMIRQLDIKILITKASGSAGGFEEKLEAAESTGCTVIVVDRPVQEDGFTVKEVLYKVGLL